MDSGAMIYIPSFIKTGSGIHTQTHADINVLSHASFYFSSKENRIKIKAGKVVPVLN
jgi:hypothetical protein